MSKLPRFYWDSCAWLGLINGEPDKKRELAIIYENAKKRKCEIWTSALSLVEVRRLKVEEHTAKPLDSANEAKIAGIFLQSFIKVTPLDIDIANKSRTLFRETPI